MQFLAPIIKLISAYDSSEWEAFVHEWQTALNTRYKSVRKFGGTGDLGRDVVGFVDDQKFDGAWDNYQCKHYRTLLAPADILIEIAKILYYSSQGAYTPPRACNFVTPRGIFKAGLDLLGSPKKLKAEIIAKWDSSLGKQISESEEFPLTAELQAWIDAYDFSSFGWVSPEDLLHEYRQTGHWAERFGGALPEAPKGVVPPQIGPGESKYIRHLLDAYEDKAGVQLADCTTLASHHEFGSDLAKQRERFFDAEAFAHTYRDQTQPGTVEDFVEQIHQGVDPVIRADHVDGFERLCATLKHAGSLGPANILSQRAKPQVKQGVCHQLANLDLLWWRKR